MKGTHGMDESKSLTVKFGITHGCWSTVVTPSEWVVFIFKENVRRARGRCGRRRARWREMKWELGKRVGERGRSSRGPANRGCSILWGARRSSHLAPKTIVSVPHSRSDCRNRPSPHLFLSFPWALSFLMDSQCTVQ